MSTQDRAARRKVHWAKTQRLTYVVLAIWFAFAILAPWFAKELDQFTFLGFPLGFYLLVQGSLIVFLLLIVGQNMIQDGIDDAYGVGDTH